MEIDTEFTAVTPITELGRRILAEQLAIIRVYQSDLSQDSSITAVHETRKAIRRTFTAVKLFSPFFEPGRLDDYRRQLRPLMKQLAVCRDTAVFLGKLHEQMADAPRPLDALEQYWQGQLTAANAALRLYLEQPHWPSFWADYAAFTAAPEAGGPLLARQVLPVLLYQRVADVLAYDAYVNGSAPLSIKKLHRLRIQCKELRYTFQFFTPLLGPEIEPMIDVLKQLQVNLGDLNDARVALELLARTPSKVETAVAHYQTVQNSEINRLLAEFHPLWAALRTPAWRRNLNVALIGLMKVKDG